MDLTSYGAISSDFPIIAQLSKLLKKIDRKELEEIRLDCYPVVLSEKTREEIVNKFVTNGIDFPSTQEIFKPSKNYPSHRDGGGISYFIPLEEGCFTIENVNYPIVPFVLYAFEDSKLHNTDFGAIMLK